MGRPPCCDKANVKRGLWTAEEDAKILAYVSNHGIGNWTQVPKKAGLNRCGKSCRLRWTNYLRPDLKHEEFTKREEELIVQFHEAIGSRWSLIAKQLPGRTDNDVKNYWNTKLKKKLHNMGIDPITHKPLSKMLSDYETVNGLITSNYQMRSMNRSLQPSILSGSQMTNNNCSSFNHLGQLEVIDHESFNHYMFDEVSHSSSSSSSNPSQLSPVMIWGEQSLGDSFPTSEITTEEGYSYQGFQGKPSQTNHMMAVVDDCEGVAGNTETSNSCEPSSSVNSFVKALLDRDSQMQLDFPAFDDILDY